MFKLVVLTDEEIAQFIIHQSKKVDEEENKNESEQILVSKWQTHEAIDILREH
jgi:hypothetical protein